MGAPTVESFSAAKGIALYLLHTADLGITYGGTGRNDGVLQGMCTVAGRGHEAKQGVRERHILQALSDASWEAGL